jgi:hypothetical protein
VQEPKKRSGEESLQGALVDAAGGALNHQAVQRALLEAQIRILTEEAVATSAIEGIPIDAKMARRSIIKALAVEAGLLPAGPPSE